MKVVLVIDKPKTCADCIAIRDYKDYLECAKEGRQLIDYTIPTWCPLKLLPQKKEIDTEVYINYRAMNKGYQCGWNACIDEILGETE